MKILVVKDFLRLQSVAIRIRQPTIPPQHCPLSGPKLNHKGVVAKLDSATSNPAEKNQVARSRS